MDGTRLETVEQFVYLGRMVQTDGNLVRRSGEGLGLPAQHWTGLANLCLLGASLRRGDRDIEEG